MRSTRQEFANPREWLIGLAEKSDGYRLLVSESHGFARAAYRLARARCRANDSSEPCLDDLQAAATLLANCLGSGGRLPIQSLLPSRGSQPPAAVTLPPAAPLQPTAPSRTVPPAPPQRRAASKSRPHTNRASV